MNKQLLVALETCLQAMENGETIDSAMAHFPHLAAELRPLLETAQAARAVSFPPASPQVVNAGRVRVLAATAKKHASSTSPRRMGTALRVSFAFAAVLGFLVLSGVGLDAASARALPGDMLYPLKRTFENTRLQFAPDSASHEHLQEEFNQHRVEEAHTLISEGRSEPVEFHGTVTAQTTDGWMIAGIPVVVTAQTKVSGTITVGVEVEVTGETGHDGKLRATSLVVKDSEPDGETNGSRTPEATGLPESPLDTPQVTATPKPTEDSKSGSSATQTPKPTDSSGSNNGSSATTGPTDSSGSQNNETKTPDPSKTPEPTKTPN